MTPPAAPDEGNTPLKQQQQQQQPATLHPPPAATDCEFVICGAGIVGLVLALCLHKDLGILPHLYEQAESFSFTIGAGMGMYPNGLRVLRHISSDLLHQVQTAGYPYLFRRYERHDGTSVAVAQEEKLQGDDDDEDDTLQSMGIRRGRLQQILFQAVQAAKIPVHFGKRIATVQDEGTTVLLTFCDASQCRTKFLFATDGARSQVRTQVLAWQPTPQENHDNHGGGAENDLAVVHRTTPPVAEDLTNPASPQHERSSSRNDTTTTTTKKKVIVPTDDAITTKTTPKSMDEVPKLVYAGTTCFYGLASIGRPQRGICFPSSLSSKFHAVFFPTGENEQCFQLHFPVPDLEKAMDTWGEKSAQETRAECHALAKQMRNEGWHEDYLKPLENVTNAIRLGFALLKPRLSQWVYGAQRRIILLGDAAHPPVPYVGQGAQMGLEDAGTLALLMKHMCLDIDGKFQTNNFGAMTKIFEQIRIPRTRTILDKSKFWGKVQQQRSESESRNKARETLIKRDVFFHETLPILFPGATYNYVEEVERVFAKESIHLAMVKKEETIA